MDKTEATDGPGASGKNWENMIPFAFVSAGDRCHGRYRMAGKDAPVLVIATGGSAKGSLSQSWTSYPDLLDAVSISCVIFDFSGQGLSEGKRCHLTVSKGVQNLNDVLAHILEWDLMRDRKLALMGSSFGGNVVLEFLASNPSVRINGAVFKSPCIDLRESYFQELGAEGMAKWEEAGYSEETGLMWEVIEECDSSDLRFRLKKITTPLLITHGTLDESVPISQSRDIRDSVSGIVDLVEMKGTNHHYSDRDDWQRMAALHVSWLKQLFSK